MAGWLNDLYGKKLPERSIEERRRVVQEVARGFDRVKYQREYMRMRRALKKKLEKPDA